MPVSAEAVWSSLADGYSYADWVVGTRHIRSVDLQFPEKGASLHYTVGWGMLSHDGHTEVVGVEPGRCLELAIHAWPVATVYTKLTIEERGENRVEVTMVEHPSRGPAAVLHNPVTELLLKIRNVETLRRLERVARTKAADQSAQR
jgi:hypothetical protein